ncbi:hypothetical protein FB446DRAFT_789551 [Lentinula raphanica]|nr:hypothetical protein FB446DRAFT_789551 [Lentinula raphanica]
MPAAPAYVLAFDTLAESTAKSHWTLFTASIVNDKNIRDTFVSMVHTSAANTNQFTVFPTTYDTTSGQPNGGPAQGAMFALLAVNATRQLSGSNAAVAENRGSKVNKAGAIAGGIIGGVAFLALVALAVFFYRKLKGRKRNRVHSSVLPYLSDPKPLPTQHTRNPLLVKNSKRAGKSGQNQSPVTSLEQRPANPTTRKVPSANSAAGSSDTGTSRSGAEAELLRGEVENLPREMEQIQLRVLYLDPPPDYQ